ncbi:hypothetical protein SAMD00024442_27_25 [Candidatus Symbiothrix dinenymphae]|nr:hypothetical protein SAMD00024442_27_25 [Candidatus Symbiothrix dinenymphae]
MKKIFFTTAIALFACSTAFAVGSGSVENPWLIGTPNAESVIATLSDGTLTISGQGAMSNFTNYSAPWFLAGAENCSVTKVVIEDKVTRIGEYAFYGCKNLKSLSIKNDEISIGRFAFHDCNDLAAVTFGSNDQSTFVLNNSEGGVKDFIVSEQHPDYSAVAVAKRNLEEK